jgi:threonine synthase
MELSKIFCRQNKKEKSLKQKNCEEIEEYIEAIEAIDEINWLDEKEKRENYKNIAKKVLELLPSEVKVFELSTDVFAKRRNDTKSIEDSDIKDLEWVREYSADNT